MSVKMSEAKARMYKHFVDWNSINKEVSRYINEDNDCFSVSCGGFTVTFGDQEAELTNAIAHYEFEEATANFYRERYNKLKEYVYKLAEGFLGKTSCRLSDCSRCKENGGWCLTHQHLKVIEEAKEFIDE